MRHVVTSVAVLTFVFSMITLTTGQPHVDGPSAAMHTASDCIVVALTVPPYTSVTVCPPLA